MGDGAGVLESSGPAGVAVVGLLLVGLSVVGVETEGLGVGVGAEGGDTPVGAAALGLGVGDAATAVGEGEGRLGCWPSGVLPPAVGAGVGLAVGACVLPPSSGAGEEVSAADGEGVGSWPEAWSPLPPPPPPPPELLLGVGAGLSSPPPSCPGGVAEDAEGVGAAVLVSSTG